MIIPDAVRRAGPTGASGKEWTLFAPRCAVSPFDREGAARCRRRARLTSREARVRPQPHYHCARTCCSPARRRGSPRFGCLSILRGGRGGCRVGVARSVALRVPRSVRAAPFGGGSDGTWGSAGYLVDPASSHMLVSKIKPCMSKYKRLVL